MQAVVTLNPFTPYAQAYQQTVFFGEMPGLGLWLRMLAISLVVWAAGAWLFERLSGTLVMLSDELSVSAALLLVAPLAFFMGMPFPVAIEALSRKDAALIPWAWGANGCASVVGAVLAVIIATSYGGSWVITIGLALYLGAGVLGSSAFGDAA